MNMLRKLARIPVFFAILALLGCALVYTAVSIVLFLVRRVAEVAENGWERLGDYMGGGHRGAYVSV